MKQDIRDAGDVRRMVEGFYARVLQDEILRDIFLETAQVNLEEHLPRICKYWEKLLLGIQGYSRHTMNIHRRLHAKRPLRPHEFERWLQLFCANVDEQFAGETAERAKRVAHNVAANMQARMGVTPPAAGTGGGPGLR